MKKQDMLLGGPGLKGYVYNADIYCIDCGQNMIKDFVPDSGLNELDAHDSDIAPQPMFFPESEVAQHCAVCKEYLYGGNI